jgi:hypothetical protein
MPSGMIIQFYKLLNDLSMVSPGNHKEKSTLCISTIHPQTSRRQKAQVESQMAFHPARHQYIGFAEQRF